MRRADIRSLDVAMLRAFDALLRERSVSRAADRLFLSQPAVSAALARLRTAFDDALFTRTAYGIVPTPRALELAPRVERVLAELNALLEPAEFDPARSERIFRIAGADLSSRFLLPALVKRLDQLGSRIRIDWDVPPFATMLDRLKRGGGDLAVLPRPEAPRDADAALLLEDGYGIAMRVGHPAFGAGATLDALCSVSYVSLGYGLSPLDEVLDNELAKGGRRRFVQAAVASFAQIVDVLLNSDAVAVLPLRLESAYPGRLEWHAAPFTLPRYRLYLCSALRPRSDPALEWLRRTLVEIAAASTKE